MYLCIEAGRIKFSNSIISRTPLIHEAIYQYAVSLICIDWRSRLNKLPNILGTNEASNKWDFSLCKHLQDFGTT